MTILRKEFSELGFVLAGMDNLIYLSKEPDDPPVDCGNKICMVCLAGCMNGGMGNET